MDGTNDIAFRNNINGMTFMLVFQNDLVNIVKRYLFEDGNIQ